MKALPKLPCDTVLLPLLLLLLMPLLLLPLAMPLAMLLPDSRLLN